MLFNYRLEGLKHLNRRLMIFHLAGIFLYKFGIQTDQILVFQHRCLQNFIYINYTTKV